MNVKSLAKPFFELGPKNYRYGDQVLELARIADEASEKYGIPVIYTTPYANIESVARQTKHLYVFAPYMDNAAVGRGLANVLPESVKAAGAVGVMLNHVERLLTLSTLYGTMERAKSLGMLTVVCADSLAEVRAVAELSPDVIVAEPAELIGRGAIADLGYVTASCTAVRSINPDIAVLIGAGVSNGRDAYNIIRAGADATGCSSGVACSKDPRATLEDMLAGVREAWAELHDGKKAGTA
jgi:triosephosphate isomerase